MLKNNFILKFLIFLFINSIFISTYGQSFSIVTGTNLPNLADSKIVSADYDHDGDYDILISGIDNLSNTVCKLYNNMGDNTFTNSGNVFAQINKGDLVFFDINNDNYPDILISGKDKNNKKITEIYLNNKNNTFSKIITPIDSLAYSAIKTADFDNDGFQDIIISGIDNNNNKICKIYRNNQSNNFEFKANFEGISNGSIAIGDFNKDGLFDFIITGNSINQKIAKIYINNGDFNFSVLNGVLPEISYSSLAVGDYNTDGYSDIAIMGEDVEGNYYTKIFKNLTNGTFSEISSSFTNLYLGSIKFADFDNDGDLDLATMGFDNSTRRTLFYENQDNDNFVLINLGITDIAQGDLNFADFDNDSDLDFIISGFSSTNPTTLLYKNNTGNLNSAPTKPNNTSSSVDKNSAFLTWNKSTDLQTNSNSLTYNIAIGTTKNSFDIVSPSSNISTGFSYFQKQGHLFTNNFALINNLPTGKYYWQVQAIDNSFKASNFSDIDSFIVCGKINIGNDTSICKNSNLHLSVGSGSDVVNWYSKNNGLLVSNSFELSYKITSKDSIWAELHNYLACTIRDSIVVNTVSLPTINLPADTAVCKNSTCQIDLKNSPDSTNWYISNELFIKNSSIFSNTISSKQIVIAEVFSASSCMNRDTITIDALALPTIDLVGDTSLCNKSILELNVQNIDSVNWYSDNKILKLNSFSISSKITNNDTLLCEFFDINKCRNIDTVFVHPFALPIANAGNDTTICFNTNTIIGGNPIATSGTEPYSFIWDNNVALSDINSANPICSPTSSDFYILSVSDKNNCKDKDTVYVTVNPQTRLEYNDTTTICNGQSVLLGGSPTASGSLYPYLYQWSASENIFSNYSNPIIKPNESNSYRLIVSTYKCTSDTVYIQINVKPNPKIDAGKDLNVGLGDEVSVTVSGADTYEWFPEIFISHYNDSTVIIKPDESTQYVIVGKNNFGCTDIDTLQILVKNDIFIPNLFTPNNDGKNDYFKVYGMGIDQISMQIFDKNGRIVFQSTDKEQIMNQGWDGTFNNTILPDGAYIWIIHGKFSDGTMINYNSNKGTIYLMH